MLPEYFPYMALSMGLGLPRLDPPKHSGPFSPRVTYKDPVKPVKKRRNKRTQMSLQKRRTSKASRRKNRG